MNHRTAFYASIVFSNSFSAASSFLDSVTKFFMEAKKPSINIEHAIHPAYQVKRYAWSAKLPLAILSDFKEFAVYEVNRFAIPFIYKRIKDLA